MKSLTSPHIDSRRRTIEFFMHNDCASHVCLAGSFNNWAQDVLPMEPDKDGLWKIEIPLLPAGKYRYKFFIDDRMWTEDIDSPNREPDGKSGFDSILVVNE